jgi:hypothetical protein
VRAGLYQGACVAIELDNLPRDSHGFEQPPCSWRGSRHTGLAPGECLPRQCRLTASCARFSCFSSLVLISLQLAGKGSRSWCIFKRKCFNLAAGALDSLSKRLDLPDQAKRNTSICLHHVIEREHTRLMRDHRLDTLLICCVKAVCSLSPSAKKFSFSHIIKKYSLEPQV